jgi:ABC-2 type transport system permease protein
VIDSFDLAYFAIFIVTFLLLSIRRLDRERLHG